MNDMTGVVPVRVVRAEGPAEPGSSEVAREHPLEILVDGEAYKTLLCTASMLPELAAGQLLADGRIRTAEEIASLELDSDGRTVRIGLQNNTGYNSAGIEYKQTLVSSGRIFALTQAFSEESSLHRATAGTHSVLLECGGAVVCRAEDIGRHNALDKALGAALLRRLDRRDCILFTSGRVAEETVRKVVQAGMPVLVSKAVPTLEAVRLAQAAGLTLIGRAGPDRYEIYSGPGK